ncbi:MAG: DUF2799 domain-containing protein [Pseudomonadota bacterium]
MNVFKLLITMSALVVLSGCATMSEEECVMSDWQTVGYEDGVLGKSPASIGTYRKACAKAGVTPDLDAYRAGHDEGLVLFCRPQNGYRVGENGGRYNGVCARNDEAGFLAAYEQGRTLYSLRSDVASLSSQLASARDELLDIEQQIESETLRMIGSGLSAEQRLQILSDTKALAARKSTLKDDIEYLVIELDASRDRLDAFEQVQVAGY